jgi:hypothetical protein
MSRLKISTIRFNHTSEFGKSSSFIDYCTQHDIVREGSPKSDTIVQKGYDERVLKTFGMWDWKTCATPLDVNSRLSKEDFPQVVDPTLHHRYRSITGSLSYLVNMTRPDLAFAYSQLNNFVQYPDVVHLQDVERVLQYVCGTYDQGITYCDLGAEINYKLIGWVISCPSLCPPAWTGHPDNDWTYKSISIHKTGKFLCHPSVCDSHP